MKVSVLCTMMLGGVLLACHGMYSIHPGLLNLVSGMGWATIAYSILRSGWK